MLWNPAAVIDPFVGLSLLAVVGAVGVAFDLSVVRRLDAATRAALLDGIEDGYLVLDATGEITDANETARELLALDETGATRPPALVDGMESLLRDLETADQTSGVVTLGDRAGADRLAVECVTLPGGSEERATLVTVRDVTRERQIERRYRAFTESGTDLVVVLDRDGTITFASPSFETVLGYEPATLEGQSVLTDIQPESQDTFEHVFEQLLADPDTRHRFEYSVQAADGTWHVFEGIGRNLFDDDLVDGIVVTSRDITDRKRQERDLRRQNERLEEFASVVSHDLRNPLQVAQGNVEHLESAVDEERHLPAIRRSLDRMEELIADVLELARQGKRVTETSTVSVETVARDAWDTVETGDRTLRVVGDSTLQADTRRLQQLFENLFRNAVEHAGPDVTVTVGPIEPMHTGTRIMEEQAEGFYVADDGRGVPDDIRDEVFDSGTSTATDGTGLGLAIVEQIVEAHGWEVSATDSRADGARFEITDVRGSKYQTE